MDGVVVLVHQELDITWLIAPQHAGPPRDRKGPVGMRRLIDLDRVFRLQHLLLPFVRSSAQRHHESNRRISAADIGMHTENNLP